jgi:hypothetical protein
VDEAVAGAVERLAAIEEVELIARTRGTAELIVLYHVDGARLDAAIATGAAVTNVLLTAGLEVVIEGLSVPAVPGA